MKTNGSRTYDSSSEPSIEEKFERVRGLLRPGRLGGSEYGFATIIDVIRDADSALVTFLWTSETKPLALRIDLRDTSREFYYDEPVRSFEEWIRYLDVHVMVSFDTGVVERAKRIDRPEYIELVGY